MPKCLTAKRPYLPTKDNGRKPKSLSSSLSAGPQPLNALIPFLIPFT